MNPFDPGYFMDSDLADLGFAKLGLNVQIARNCTIIGLERIEIGSNVRIDGPTTIVVGNASKLVLGNFIHISGGCHISAATVVEFGDFSGLSQGVKIFSATDDYSGSSLTNPTVPERFKKVQKAPVKIGRHVIVGTGSVVLPGASIGEGSAIGALSLVKGPIGDWGIFAGNPAKFIKARSKEILQKEVDFLLSLSSGILY